jgi:hypothetical protein
MSETPEKVSEEKPERKKISTRTKSANERSSRISRDKEHVISKSELLAKSDTKSVKKVRDKTDSHSKIAQVLDSY